MTDRKVIVLRAIDWGLYAAQVSEHSACDRSNATIVGFLISEDDEKIVLTPQWFDGEEGTRCTLVIPNVCVLERKEYVEVTE